MTVKNVDVTYENQIKNNKYIREYRNKINNKKLNGICNYTYTTNSDKYKCVANYNKGILNGYEKTYKNDTLFWAFNYTNGFKEGKQLHFYKNDSIVSYYKEGIQEGPETEYHDGKITRTITFKNGLKTGEEKYFNASGIQSAYANYSFAPYNDEKEDNHELQNYLMQKFKFSIKDPHQNFKINSRFFNTDSISISFLSSMYNYLGHIESTGTIDYEKNQTSYSEPHIWFELGIETVSKSLGITLAKKDYTSLIGFFYTVDVNLSEFASLETLKLIVFIDQIDSASSIEISSNKFYTLPMPQTLEP